MTIEERFWSHVDTRGPDECWPWMASRGGKGYGAFNTTGGNQVYAHRFAYELVKGPIPEGLGVCHSCDNRPRCNPAHLCPGTQLDNMHDAVSKGRTASGERNGSRTHPERQARGERHGSAKLTEANVREIRRLSAEGHTQTAIGGLMGVDHGTVWRIVRGETWRHVLPTVEVWG